MDDDRDTLYWRPQVMRHTLPGGRLEYAIHEVYFKLDSPELSWTVDALSARKGTVAELEAWIRDEMTRAGASVVCGDLGYSYEADDLARWLKHIDDPPIDYLADEEA